MTTHDHDTEVFEAEGTHESRPATLGGASVDEGSTAHPSSTSPEVT